MELNQVTVNKANELIHQEVNEVTFCEAKQLIDQVPWYRMASFLRGALGGSRRLLLGWWKQNKKTDSKHNGNCKRPRFSFLDRTDGSVLNEYEASAGKKKEQYKAVNNRRNKA